MKKVELRTAFIWDCDECGRENLERIVPLILSDEEMREACDAFPGFALEQDKYFGTKPNVTCKFCSTQFKTIYKDFD